jgi:hypothetical protein
MKKAFIVVAVVCLAALLATPASAMGKFSAGVGGDILLPVGNFGDVFSIGFGGSARGEYAFTPMLSAGLTIGYYTWTAKDVAAGLVKPSFHGLPVEVYGKYYFMPAGKLRVYGQAQLGLFFWSQELSIAAITIPGFGTIGGGSVSTTGSDFALAPVVGVEIPAGKIDVDISARFDVILTTGSSTSNLGARVGVNFPIGG